MLPLDMAVTSSYRLTTVTMFLSAAVWLQFLMQSCCLQPITHVRRITVSYPSVDCSVRYSCDTIACYCRHSEKSLFFRDCKSDLAFGYRWYGWPTLAIARLLVTIPFHLQFCVMSSARLLCRGRSDAPAV